MTIPKSALQSGAVPAVFIDGREADSWGYSQDSLNFYVWYSTHFSVHQVQIMFQLPPAPHGLTETPILLYAFAAIIVAVALAAVLLMMQRKRQSSR